MQQRRDLREKRREKRVEVGGKKGMCASGRRGVARGRAAQWMLLLLLLLLAWWRRGAGGGDEGERRDWEEEEQKRGKKKKKRRERECGMSRLPTDPCKLNGDLSSLTPFVPFEPFPPYREREEGKHNYIARTHGTILLQYSRVQCVVHPPAKSTPSPKARRNSAHDTTRQGKASEDTGKQTVLRKSQSLHRPFPLSSQDPAFGPCGMPCRLKHTLACLLKTRSVQEIKIKIDPIPIARFVVGSIPRPPSWQAIMSYTS